MLHYNDLRREIWTSYFNTLTLCIGVGPRHSIAFKGTIWVPESPHFNV